MCVCARARLVMSDSAIPWTVAHQAPLSMEILQAILEWVAMPSARGTFPTQESYQGLLH